MVIINCIVSPIEHLVKGPVIGAMTMKLVHISGVSVCHANAYWNRHAPLINYLYSVQAHIEEVTPSLKNIHFNHSTPDARACFLRGMLGQGLYLTR